jgi:hypothetical protein
VCVGGSHYGSVHLESDEEFRDVNGCGVEGFSDLLAVEPVWVIGGQEVKDFLFAHLLFSELPVPFDLLSHPFLAQACEGP